MARIGRKLGWIALLLGIPVAVQGQVVKEFDRTAQMHDTVSLGFGGADDQASSGPSAPADTAGDSGSGGSGAEKMGLAHAFWHRLQVHGTLSQGFIYGSGNNYLTLHSNDGSARWSEGAINVSTAIRDNFHAGIPPLLHSERARKGNGTGGLGLR
jgi:hypothetical protein